MKARSNILKALAQGTGAVIGIKVLYNHARNQTAFCSDATLNNEKLVGLVLITRHGARTPLHLIDGIEQAEYTPDLLKPYVEARYNLVTLNGEKFTDGTSRNDIKNLNFLLKGGAGKGQLTTLGEKQMYRLGQQLKERYVNDLKFLSPTYDKNEAYIRSSNLNRTINSAKSLLSGLYLDSPLDSRNDPFTIHVKDEGTDYLYPNISSCKYLAKFYKGKQSTNMLLKNDNYKEFINNLGDLVGRKLAWGPFSAICFLDDLKVRIAHEKSVPEKFLGQIEKADYFSTVEMKSDMTSKLHLFFGQLLNLLKVNLQQSVKNELSGSQRGHKLHYFSAHDTTINGILLSIGLVDDETHSWPPFAANIILELWKEHRKPTDQNENNFFIRFYYCGKLMEIKDGNSSRDKTKCSVKDFYQILGKNSISLDIYEDLCKG